MTEHVGRHAAREPGETLILPAVSGADDPVQVPRSAGKHASGRQPGDAEPAEAPGSGPQPSARQREQPGRFEPPGHFERPDHFEQFVTPAHVGDFEEPARLGRFEEPAPLGPFEEPDQFERFEEPAQFERAERAGEPELPRPAAAMLHADRAADSAARQPAPSAAERGGDHRPIRLVWVYPDLLSTYGDRGNLLVLMRRAQLRDLDVEAIEVKSDEPVPADGDIYLLGGGEDLPQILAANRLHADGGLMAAAEQGAVIFAVCAGYQLLGREFGGVEGEPVAGLDILDVSSGRGERRGVGEIVADVDPSLGVPRLTGFENHQGVTRIGPGARPLARVTLGVGNGDGTEGAYAGNVLGTYLHGPALARNPGLADLLLSWVAGPLPPLEPAAEEWARQLRGERLAATPG
jgi:CobQ-like glutamine amidotransferase family enzyme